MRTHFLILLLSLATLTAAAQTPVYNRFPPSTAQGAEILFNDGTTHHYSVVRIAKDVMRVRATSDQSTRIPLSFINTVRFTDGGTFYFEDGKFLFDKLVQPAFLKSESGDVLLEGVLQLTKEQAATLMGPETYAEYRKNNRLLQAGVITLSAALLENGVLRLEISDQGCGIPPEEFDVAASPRRSVNEILTWHGRGEG